MTKKAYPITIGLVIINIVVFIICEFIGPTENNDVLLRCGAFFTPYITDGEYYRLIFAMFLHSGIRHLLNNMLLLAAIGSTLEVCVGKWRYLIIYLLGGLIGNLMTYAVYLYEGKAVLMVGASGCVYAIMGGLVYVILRNGGRVRELSFKQMVLLLALSIYFSVTDANAANMTHLISLAAGFVLAILIYHGQRRKTRGR